MNKKKVVFILPRMGGGGAERVVSIVANGLAKRDFLVSIAVLVGEDSYYRLDDSVQFITADLPMDRSSRFTRKISMMKGFGKSISFVKTVIQDYQPDVVIPLLTSCEIVGYLATRGMKNTIRVSSERNDPTRENYGTRKLKEFIYKSSDLLICQSQTVASYYKCVPKEKKCVIPNPIDQTLMPAPMEESKPARVVSVGRLTSQKNMTLLVKAFGLIADEFKDVTLTIYGEGPKRAEIEEVIRSANLQERIFLPGASADVFHHIKDAALFVMPSDYEGFPNALLEAMALKIPVISTDFATGVAREIVTKDFGAVVPCRDEHSMASAMEKFLRDDALRRRIRTQENTELNKYNVDRVIDMWDKSLTKAIEEQQKPR